MSPVSTRDREGLRCKRVGFGPSTAAVYVVADVDQPGAAARLSTEAENVLDAARYVIDRTDPTEFYVRGRR